VPPEGAARLAAWLIHGGFEVAALDVLIEGYDVHVVEGKTVRYGLSVNRAAARIADWSPDVIGFSCPFTCTEPDVIEIAKACRSLLPDTLIVIGGAHAAANATALLGNESALDLVAVGEGEQAITSLLLHVNRGGSPVEMDGFAFRGPDGGIRQRPLKSFIDLDRLPLPAWDLFPLDAYAKANAPHFGVGQGRRYLPTTWSRGCVNACSYCLTPRLWGRGNYRRRSIAKIIDEARSLKQEFKIEEMHIEDDCLLADKDWFHAVLDAMAQENLGLRLDFPNGLDVTDLDETTVAKLARANTVRVGLAFDAGEPEKQLRWVGKRVSLKLGSEVVAMLHDVGISLIGYFMLGFPGQTIDDMRATVDYALSMDLDALSLFIVTPFPGTPLHTYCKRKGLLVAGRDLRDYRFSTGHIHTAEFGPGDTERLRHEGWLKFQNRRRAP